jgi:hypothetical protein
MAAIRETLPVMVAGRGTTQHSTLATVRELSTRWIV